jgi:hypothetical protein
MYGMKHGGVDVRQAHMYQLVSSSDLDNLTVSTYCPRHPDLATFLTSMTVPIFTSMPLL